jgi:Tol biopolymer transport system component
MANSQYDLETGSQDLWIFDLKTNAGRRLSAEPAGRDAAVWRPDSKKIAFGFGAPNETSGIRLRGLGEIDTQKTTPASGFQIPLDWSPDGRFLAFMNVGLPRFANEQQSDIFLIDLALKTRSCRCCKAAFTRVGVFFLRTRNGLRSHPMSPGRMRFTCRRFGRAPYPV